MGQQQCGVYDVLGQTKSFGLSSIMYALYGSGTVLQITSINMILVLFTKSDASSNVVAFWFQIGSSN